MRIVSNWSCISAMFRVLVKTESEGEEGEERVGSEGVSME